MRGLRKRHTRKREGLRKRRKYKCATFCKNKTMGKIRRIMNKEPINDNPTTRIIPGLTSQYQIVSLPYWAWFWLDDFMQQHRISYQGIYEAFSNGKDLSQTLHNLAELHQEYSMREVYNLANDNEIDQQEYLEKRNKQPKKEKPKELRLPKIYKLFGFMSCATSLEAVWSRRHYDENNKIN